VECEGEDQQQRETTLPHLFALFWFFIGAMPLTVPLGAARPDYAEQRSRRAAAGAPKAAQPSPLRPALTAAWQAVFRGHLSRRGVQPLMNVILSNHGTRHLVNRRRFLLTLRRCRRIRFPPPHYDLAVGRTDLLRVGGVRLEQTHVHRPHSFILCCFTLLPGMGAPRILKCRLWRIRISQGIPALDGAGPTEIKTGAFTISDPWRSAEAIW
jgi:hypothetical protein